MLLDIQKFLAGFSDIRTGNLILSQKFNIVVTEDYLKISDNTMLPVWIYNYDIIKSKGKLKITNEARGLILDANKDIVSMSFPRFFNYGEGPAAEINWDNAHVEFKHDGTLIAVYAHRGKYFIQTRGRANADGPLLQDRSRTYYDAVTEILKKKSNSSDPFAIFRKHNQNDKYVWVFEYVGPKNRHITPYKEEDLILLAAFNKSVPGEIVAEHVEAFAENYGISMPAKTHVSSIEDVYEIIDEIDVLEEGVVVIDNCNHRVKVKKPSFLAISRVKNNSIEDLRPRHFAEIVLNGDGDEVANYYPEYKPILIFFERLVTELMGEVQTNWLRFRIAGDRKVFAENVRRLPFCHLLFLAWEGKITNMTDALKYIKPSQLVALGLTKKKNEMEFAFETSVNRRRKEKEVRHLNAQESSC